MTFPHPRGLLIRVCSKKVGPGPCPSSLPPQFMQTLEFSKSSSFFFFFPRQSTFQTFRKEVCLTDHSMYPGPCAPTCCECQTRFGGRLPVPRAEAALPYWVPLSLRPPKQIPKRLRSYIPQTTKMCPCPCHRFGGHLPVPRDQAAMPYWVPRVLRSQKQVARRQQSAKGIQEAPLDSSSRHNRWRICCDDGRLLLRWQQLQALHGDRPPVPGGPTYLLPLGLCLLALLQAVLRVIMAIRCAGELGGR
uniref:Chromosome 16 open reading frame 95 n=1 Tax=Microcebus murinus TaxID=30608 RepID=A0A8C5VHA2_MICMU